MSQSTRNLRLAMGISLLFVLVYVAASGIESITVHAHGLRKDERGMALVGNLVIWGSMWAAGTLSGMHLRSDHWAFPTAMLSATGIQTYRWYAWQTCALPIAASMTNTAQQPTSFWTLELFLCQRGSSAHCAQAIWSQGGGRGGRRHRLIRSHLTELRSCGPPVAPRVG